MKKLILSAFAIGTMAAANAQSGSILLYGDLGISHQSVKNDDGIVGTPDTKDKTFGIQFIPGIGYQFNKNWTVGMNVGIAYNRTSTDPATIEEKERVFGIGPFVRMTQDLNRTFFLFHQLNLAYINGKTTTDNPSPVFDPVTRSNGFLANIIPAIGIRVSKCIALNFATGGLQYTWNRATNNVNAAEVTTSNFDFTMGRQINIGISANLGGKHAKGHREPGMEHRRHMDMDDDDDVEIKVKKKKVKIEEED